MNAFSTAAGDTLPNVPDLIQHRMARRTLSNEDPAAGEVVDSGIQVPPRLALVLLLWTALHALPLLVITMQASSRSCGHAED